MLKRIFEASVWADDQIPPTEWRYRGLYRWVLPLIDLMFMWFGYTGWWNGLTSVRESTTPEWQGAWSLALGIAATVALVGVSFPRLWWVELIGKLPVIGLISVYVFIIFARGVQNPAVLATSGLLVAMILFPIWRAFDLGFVSWQRKESRPLRRRIKLWDKAARERAKA